MVYRCEGRESTLKVGIGPCGEQARWFQSVKIWVVSLNSINIADDYGENNRYAFRTFVEVFLIFLIQSYIHYRRQRSTLGDQLLR